MHGGVDDKFSVVNRGVVDNYKWLDFRWSSNGFGCLGFFFGIGYCWGGVDIDVSIIGNFYSDVLRFVMADCENSTNPTTAAQATIIAAVMTPRRPFLRLLGVRVGVGVLDEIMRISSSFISCGSVLISNPPFLYSPSML